MGRRKAKNRTPKGCAAVEGSGRLTVGLVKVALQGDPFLCAEWEYAREAHGQSNGEVAAALDKIGDGGFSDMQALGKVIVGDSAGLEESLVEDIAWVLRFPELQRDRQHSFQELG